MCGSLLQSPRLDLQPGKGEQNKSGPKMRGELRWSSLYSQPRLERHPLRRKMVKEAGITHARQAGTLATACSFVRAHGSPKDTIAQPSKSQQNSSKTSKEQYSTSFGKAKKKNPG
ncbi:hypothetical protein LEMLEM_LOCUS20356 [Lemmus lemmus]